MCYIRNKGGFLGGQFMENQTIEIIKQAQAGNEEAFTQLYQDYYQSVYYKAYQMTRNEADAKDIAQEVFYEVHRSLPRLQDPKHFYAWLMVITSSRTKNLFRKHQYDTTFFENLQEINIQEKRIEANPEQYVQDKSEQEIIYELIMQMPKKYAEVIALVYLKELKLQEIADILQVPLGTVKTRAARGKKELKNLICAYENKEQRRLSFHVEGAIPLSLLFFDSIQTAVEVMVSQIKKAWHTVSTNALTSCCVVSFSALAVTGGAFLYDDMQKKASPTQKPQAQAPITQKQEEPPKQSEESFSQEALKKSAFPQTNYQGTQITSSRDAYYICLNFAYTQEEMTEHTKDEFQEILPIYEVLKNENSIHYQQLQKQGWTTLFETYAYGDI